MEESRKTPYADLQSPYIWLGVTFGSLGRPFGFPLASYCLVSYAGSKVFKSCLAHKGLCSILSLFHDCWSDAKELVEDNEAQENGKATKEKGPGLLCGRELPTDQECQKGGLGELERANGGKMSHM